MSTDPRAAVTAAAAEAPRRDGFWRLAVVLCSVLAVIAVGLGAAGWARNPDLAGVTFAPDRAVAAAGQRLVLASKLPLAEVDPAQVSVTPAVPFTQTQRESSLSLRFAVPLAYDTAYEVRVTGARSRHTGTTADWVHTFRTPPATRYTLIAHRGDQAPADTVVTEGNPEPRTMLTAPGIDSFVATRQHLVAVARPEGQPAQLVAVTRPEGAPATVGAPRVPLITELVAAPDGGSFGYLVSGPDADSGREYESILFIQDATALDRPAVEVTAGGQPMSVQEWLFVPGVNAVVVSTAQEQGFLIYLDGATAPVPLGRLSQLVGFLPGSATLHGVASGRQVMIDLAGGRTADVVETADPDKNTFAGRRSFRATDDYLVEYNRFSDAGLTTRLDHVTAAGSTTLLTVGPGKGQLLNSGLSPNGQFAWAVVLAEGAPISDLSSGASNRAVVRVFDLATGREVATLPGSTPVWAT